MRILLVDDDENLMESLAERLIQQRYAVDITVDGSSAETYVDLFDYDLIVLDLMLPDGDGIQFAKKFREEGYANPLMILTAKESTVEKVKALDAGADDYVVKPFDFDELCARIRALLRRENQGLPPILSWGPLRLDPSACETTYKDTSIRLTPKEFSMMELFLRHPHRVYSLGAIIDDLWSFEDPPGEDAVRTHIKGLRQKLKKAGAPKDLIKTVYGLGYRLNENTAWLPDDSVHTSDSQLDEERLIEDQSTGKEQTAEEKIEKEQTEGGRTKEEKTGSKPNSLDKQQIVQQQEIDAHPSAGYAASRLAGDSALNVAAVTSQSRLKQQLAEAGRRYLFSATTQIETIEKAVQALVQGPLAPALYREGLVCAHQLSGSLGSFGFAEGSRTARQVEDALRSLPLQPQIEASIELSSQLAQWVQTLRQSIDQALIASAADVLIIVTEDQQFSEQLITSADQYLFKSHVVTALSEATTLLQSTDCNVVLLDARAKLTHETSDFIQSIPIHTINKDSPPLIAVIGTQLELPARLSLSRQGVSLMSDRTTPPPQIMQAVANIVQEKKRQVKVAIALSDPDLLIHLDTQLTSQGFQVTPFKSVAALWRWFNLVPKQPAVDILLLDVELSMLSASESDRPQKSDLENSHLEINGLDLCRIVRSDNRLRALPIVFLAHRSEPSSESLSKTPKEPPKETNLYTQIYQAGGNDCIYLSIHPTELAVRLRNQLTRQNFTGLVDLN